MVQIGVAVYSGRLPESLVREVAFFLDELRAACGDATLLLGGYRGGMATVVDMALERGFRAVLVVPREYEEDRVPEGVIVVKTGMDTKARSDILVRSSDVLVVLGGASGTLIEAFMAYGLGVPVVFLVGHGLPSDAIRTAYPDGVLDPRIPNPLRYVGSGREASREACRLAKRERL